MAEAPRSAPPSGSRLTPRDLALALTVVTLWGYNFVPIRLALDEVPPFALAALRFVLAAIPMVLFVRPPRAPWTVVVAYGLTIGVGQFGLLFLGIQLGMPAGLSSLLMQVQVFFTIALAARFLGDPIEGHGLVGAAIAGVGILVMGVYKVETGATATVIGFVIVMGAAFCWAAGNVMAKHAARKHGTDIFGLVVWSSLAAPLPLAVLSYVAEGGTAPLAAIRAMSGIAWASVLFMAYAATLFGFAVWNGLLHRHPAGVVSPFALLIPVAGLASGALFLDETLAPMQAAGAVFVFAGLAFTIVGGRWLKTPTASPS